MENEATELYDWYMGMLIRCQKDEIQAVGRVKIAEAKVEKARLKLAVAEKNLAAIRDDIAALSSKQRRLKENYKGILC
jgi:hypothetical protein